MSSATKNVLVNTHGFTAMEARDVTAFHACEGRAKKVILIQRQSSKAVSLFVLLWEYFYLVLQTDITWSFTSRIATGGSAGCPPPEQG